MRRRRGIKLLMAKGISRNDAAAFMQVYHGVGPQGLTQIFKEMSTIQLPEPRVTVMNVQPMRLRACEKVRRGGAIAKEYFADMIKKRLLCAIVDSDAVRITEIDRGYEIEYRAEIEVIPLPKGATEHVRPESALECGCERARAMRRKTGGGAGE